MAGTRLELGVELEKLVIARGRSREDIALVLAERPEALGPLADELIRTADFIRQDRDCFALTDPEVVIKIPALKRPTLEQLRKRWGWIKKIELDDSPEEVVTLRLATVLKLAEERIDGPTYERRLVPKRGMCLGLQQLDWLMEKQAEHPAFMALLGQVYVDCPGLVVVHVGGRRGVPFAFQDGRRWCTRWSWLGHGFARDGRVAFSSKSR